MKELNIIPGFLCNFSCVHCINNSGPDRSDSSLNESEIKTIIADIFKHAPDRLLFTGGEPILYIPLINKIISGHPQPSKLSVIVTTNGYFGTDMINIRNVLGAFIKLDHLQMSFDIFHNVKTSILHIENISSYCKENGIEFNVTMAISNPLQLIEAKKILESLNVKIIYQKVLDSGRGKINNCAYQYSSFEKDVLLQKCPNDGALTFIPNKGYTACCNNLIFNHDLSEIYSKDIETYRNSDFFLSITTKNMMTLAQNKSVDLTGAEARHSSICSLCEYIHTNAKNNNYT